MSISISSVAQGLNIDDAAALKRYAATGDPAAFGVLVHRYEQMVLATCRRVLESRDDTDDAAQETFLKLARNAATIRGSAAGWLHACALGTAKDLLRKRGTRERIETAAVLASGNGDAPADMQERAWRDVEPLLDAAIEQLSEEHRAAIVGHYLANRPQLELAKEAGVSAGTMSRRINAALDLLQAKLRAAGLAVVGPMELGAVLAFGGAATSQSMAGALAKLALAEAAISGKRSVVAGVLGAWSVTKAATLLIATGVLATAGFVGFIQLGAGGGDGAPSESKTAAAAPIVVGVPQPHKSIGPFVMVGETVDGKAAADLRLVIDAERVTLKISSDGETRRLISKRIAEGTAPPRKPGGSGSVGIRVETFELQANPEDGSLLDKTGMLKYSLKKDVLQAGFEFPGVKGGRDVLPYRRSEVPVAAKGESTDKAASGSAEQAEPLIGEWLGMPIWWSIKLDTSELSFIGGGGAYRKLNPDSQPVLMIRLRVLNWTTVEGESRIEAIVAQNNLSTKTIGQRVKLLLRQKGESYELARQAWDSPNLNEWPRFDSKDGEKIWVQQFQKELP